jgi:hypothetical protein
LAHAAVVGVHALCCGVPMAAMLVAGLSGAVSAGMLLPDSFELFHQWMHGYELWILALSASLVVLGAWLEVEARRGRVAAGFPWLFAVSVGCLCINAAVILGHQA